MKRHALLLVSLLLASNFSFSAKDPTYEELVDRLAVIGGSSATEMAEPFVKLLSEGVVQHIAKSDPRLTPRHIQMVGDEVALFMHEQMLINKELRQLQYDAYKQYFSKQELLELIEFYETPLGKKLLSDLPFIMQYMQTGVDKVFRSIVENMKQDLIPRINQRIIGSEE